MPSNYTHNTRNIFCISKHHHHDDDDMTSKTIKVIFPQNYIVDSKPQPSRMAIQNVHGEKSRKNANNTRVETLMAIQVHYLH